MADQSVDQATDAAQMAASQARRDLHARREFRHLPDEVCVVVRHNGLVATHLHDDMHASVRSFLNTRIAELGRPDTILQRLEHRHPDAKHHVHIDRADGRTTGIHFFRLGLEKPERKPDDPAAPERAQARSVRDLVQLINRELAQRSAGRHSDGWHVHAATPNWLVNMAQGVHDGGGTSPPEPVAVFTVQDALLNSHGNTHASSGPIPWRIAPEGDERQVESEVTDAEGGAGPGRVVVAILDTSPSWDDVRAAAERYRDFSHLWDAIIGGANPVHFDHDLARFGPEDETLLKHYVPDWQGLLASWHAIEEDVALAEERFRRYAMPDHGLFVSGIIKDLAPEAEIHLIPVLDGAGIGDLLALIGVLAALPERLRNDSGRLIVNLSLTVDIPTTEEMLADWFPELANDDAQLRRRWADVTALFRLVHDCLAQVVDALREQGVLIVAAAGNNNLKRDGEPADIRPGPCLPAAYEHVISVASVNRAGDASSFSNRGDDSIAYGNGVATFGGDTERYGGRGAVRIAGERDQQGVLIDNGETLRPDALKGLFSAGVLPGVTEAIGATTSNDTGWVYWAGTSFATAIVSAIAANLWNAPGHAEDSPAQIATQVYQLAREPERELAAEAILVDQG